MAKERKLPPGTNTPKSGQYGVEGPRGGKQDKEVTSTKGKPLPPTFYTINQIQQLPVEIIGKIVELRGKSRF